MKRLRVGSHVGAGLSVASLLLASRVLASLMLAPLMLAPLMLPSSADAQGLRAAGHVRDSAGAPIPGAAVITSFARAETDSMGRFLLRLAQSDSTTVTVRRLGFESVSFTMMTDSLALNDLDIQLEAIARSLPGVAVREERIGRVPTLERFEERRQEKAGFGFFLGREEIAAREGQPLSNILRQARGVTVDRGGTVRFTRWTGRARSCVPHVWLDGMRVRDLELDQIPSSNVEAVELYPSASGAPLEFDSGSAFACGIVAIWTRRPILKTR